MKNSIPVLLHILSLIFITCFFQFEAGAQTLGGIPDKTFNVADSGGSVVPLNRKNQIFYPGPEAGLYMTTYDNFRFGDYPGRHLQTTTGYFDKNSVSNYQSFYSNYSGNKFGDVLTASPGNYYTVQNWLSGNLVFGVDSLEISKLTKFKKNPAVNANRFYFNKPMKGFYNTGIAQTAPNRLAFWLTRNLEDTLRPHNVTYVRSLDTSCAPLAAFYEIPGFRAEISAAYQGNIYLLGHTMNDTIPVGSRIVVLDGTTLQPLLTSFPGLPANFIGGKVQIFSILPDGKMLVAGFVSNGNFSVEQVVRLNVDGSPDSSFPISFFTGTSGVRWSQDEVGTIRCASNRVISGQNMALIGTLQPAGGVAYNSFPGLQPTFA